MTHTDTTPSAPRKVRAPFANARVWAFAARMLAKMIDWFGPPGELADAGFVNARFIWEITPWFQRLEGLVRRLVIVEAVAWTHRLPRPGGRRRP